MKSKKGSGRGDGQNRSKGRRSCGPQPDKVCWRCKETGHWGNQCLNAPHEHDDNNEKKGHSHGRVSAHAVTCDHLDLVLRNAGSVYMAMRPHPTAGVILDCGATAHMFYNRSFFVSYTCMTGQSVSVGDAQNILVRGYGCVHLRVKLPSGYHT